MKVLIIEDNPGDARLVREMLREAPGNFSINVEERLGAGLEFLASQNVDVVLLDLGLPDSRGLETLAKMQARFSHLPIVIMTSIDDEALGIQAVQQGAQDYLVKGQADGRILRRVLLYAVERKKTNEALKEKEQFLERLAGLNPAIISVIDLTNDRQIYTSKPELVLLGYKPEEIKDATGLPASIFHPGDFERMAAAAAEMKQANDNRIRDIEVRVKDAEGRWRWFQIACVIFKRDHNGLPLQSMHVAREITGRREAEEALRRRTYELEAVNKEMEAFSYSVSHNLRAPLRSMEGFSRLLLGKYGDNLDERGRTWLNHIHTSSQFMWQLIDDMLRLSRIGRAEIRFYMVNLSEIARSVADELKDAQPERKAEFIISPGAITQGDPSLLRILLQNLLENAWKYTKNAEVAVIEFGAAELNGEKVYSVKDNGIGFDIAYAHKLFKPFQRLHSSEEFPGTGIGLAIVQRIVNRHGGKVWAEGKAGGGATFFFSL